MDSTKRKGVGPISGGSITLARIAGIPIRIHFSWLFVAVLIVWSLSTGFFPARYPFWSQQTYIVSGILAGVLFFASILVHELSHAFVAMARGLPVKSITLFIFGGVSEIEEESRSPVGEFLIAVVGPLSSILIGVVSWALSFPGHLISQQVGAIFEYLALVNFLVGVFNMVPGFPLDGGRVLRAVLWGIGGNLVKATRMAAIVGKGIAYLMMIGGVFVVFTSGNLMGMWFVVIGWFLSNASSATEERTRIKAILGDAEVREAMRVNVESVVPGISIDALIEDHIRAGQQRSFPVIGGGRLWGIITLSDVARVPRDKWLTVRVEEIMTPRDRLRATHSTDLMEDALSHLQDGGVNQLLVIDDDPDRVVGILSRADLMRFLSVRQLGTDV